MNNPVLLTDPTGEVWYNPISWDWKKIGSAFQLKGGVGPGAHAKIKISKLSVSAGAKAILGLWLEGQEDKGIYLSGNADLLRVEWGEKGQGFYAEASLGWEYDLKINTHAGTATEYIDKDFLSFKAGVQKGEVKNNLFGDWLEFGG